MRDAIDSDVSDEGKQSREEEKAKALRIDYSCVDRKAIKKAIENIKKAIEKGIEESPEFLKMREETEKDIDKGISESIHAKIDTICLEEKNEDDLGEENEENLEEE